MQYTSKGRFWQIDAGGFIINDTSYQSMGQLYNSLINNITSAIETELKQACHSIYLTGSIPRGMAQPGQSDLDMFVILNPGFFDHDGKLSSHVCQQCEFELYNNNLFNTISKLDLELWAFNEPFPLGINQKSLAPKIANNLSEYYAILKTSSLCISGHDVIPFIPRIRPGVALANIELVQLEEDLHLATSQIIKNTQPTNVRYWCQRVMKNILRAAFCLVMPKLGQFTRDIELCFEQAVRYYPDMTASLQLAKVWSLKPTDKGQEVLDFVDTFGNQLVKEIDNWMQHYNPARQKELTF